MGMLWCMPEHLAFTVYGWHVRMNVRAFTYAIAKLLVCLSATVKDRL